MTYDPPCKGYRRAEHEARYLYADGYCAACRERRGNDEERADLGVAALMDDDERERRTRA